MKLGLAGNGSVSLNAEKASIGFLPTNALPTLTLNIFIGSEVIRFLLRFLCVTLYT